ncbi:MAG: tetratricopeptide repeat protein [Chthonomonadales bacterium]
MPVMRFRGVGVLFGCLTCLLTGDLGGARPAPLTVLIFSYPAKGIPAREFVDFAPFVARSLQDDASYAPKIFRPKDPQVQAALSRGELTPADLAEPFAPSIRRKIGRAVGADFVLTLSGSYTKAGVAAEAQMERLVGQREWSVVFVQKLAPYRAKGSKPSLLEGINAQTALIVQQITHNQTPIPVSPPVDVKTGQVVPQQSHPPALTAEPQGTLPARPREMTAAKPSQPASSVSAEEILVDRFRRQGDLPNLIMALRKAVTAKPKDASLRSQLIRAYLDAGLKSAALDEARRAVALLPGSAPLCCMLGHCLLSRGANEEAVAQYRMAVQLDPKDAANYVALADGYWALAQPDAAVKALQDGVACDPNNPLPHRKLARMYAELGRYSDAASEFNMVRMHAKPDESDGVATDYADLCRIAANGLGGILNHLQNDRQDLATGKRTREQVYTGETQLRKQTSDLSSFLEALEAPAGYARVKSLFAQAASLTAQALDLSLRSLEARDASHEEEATVMRLEASRQVKDAVEALDAAQAQSGSVH